MIQVIILDTDNKMIAFSRSDEKEYTQAKEYFSELYKTKTDRNMEYKAISFKELKKILSDL